jgi:hypothetical protein
LVFLGPLCPFNGQMVYCMAIWYILWSFGIFYPFWYDVPRKIWNPAPCDQDKGPTFVRFEAGELVLVEAAPVRVLARPRQAALLQQVFGQPAADARKVALALGPMLRFLYTYRPIPRRDSISPPVNSTAGGDKLSQAIPPGQNLINYLCSAVKS